MVALLRTTRADDPENGLAIDGDAADRHRSDQIEQLKSALNKIKLESQTDSLTGVANRKQFDETLAGEISDSRKRPANRLPFACLTSTTSRRSTTEYGHRAGDSALRFVANIFHHSVRDGDLVARYGGEEFADHHARGGPLAVGVKVADRIREAMAGPGTGEPHIW